MNAHVNINDLEVGFDVPAKPGMDESEIQEVVNIAEAAA